MNFTERYVASLTATNLQDDDKHHNTEPLAAMALSTRLGTLLYRVKYDNDAQLYAKLLEEWTSIVEFKAVLGRWPAASPPGKVAKRSLDLWLFDVCPTCSGLQFEPVANMPRVLSDRLCKACKGTGRVNLKVHSQIHVHINQMAEALDDLLLAARVAGTLKLRGPLRKDDYPQ